MNKLELEESQDVEFKESWRDEYLKWICGFANAQGGRIFIGVNDNREIIGVDNSKKLMEDIPNKIANFLGLVEDVNLHKSDDKEYIEIVVASNNIPIDYKGIFHYRSGSTKQELKGQALQNFILKKMGRSWDDIMMENVSINTIDRKAIDFFLRKGISANRIAPDEKDSPTMTVLENLRLVDEDGRLKTAAVLLFGKDPQMYFAGAQFKIGRFGHSESDLIIQDVVEGNLIQMVSRVMEVLKSKYLYSPIHYIGLQRYEPLEIPEEALREILYNSVAHKDYTGAAIQMQVYDDHIEIWNEGGLPLGYTPESLMQKHSSRPRNKLIANAMFKAGFIEAWGRGYNKVKEYFDEDNYPMPIVTERDGGVCVWIKRFSLNELVQRAKNRYGDSAVPSMNTSNNVKEDEGNVGNGVGDNVGINIDATITYKLTDRQREIVKLMLENPTTTAKQMSVILSVEKRTIERDIALMRDIVRHEGTNKAGRWVVKGAEK